MLVALLSLTSALVLSIGSKWNRFPFLPFKALMKMTFFLDFQFPQTILLSLSCERNICGVPSIYQRPSWLVCHLRGRGSSRRVSLAPLAAQGNITFSCFLVLRTLLDSLENTPLFFF